MAKFKIKQEALQLRRGGMSIGGVAKVLGISKGTASIWCRDIVLSTAQRARLSKNSIQGGHVGRLKGAATNRQKKLTIVAKAEREALSEISQLSERDVLLAAVALYWAEGSKTESRFLFVNSDPAMIQIMHTFLRTQMRVPSDQVSLTIQINEIHRKRIKTVLKFWATLLDIPSTQFKKTYFIKTTQKKIYENYDTYYGIARLGVLRGSGLQYRMLGYISALKAEQ